MIYIAYVLQILHVTWVGSPSHHQLPSHMSPLTYISHVSIETWRMVVTCNKYNTYSRRQLPGHASCACVAAYTCTIYTIYIMYVTIYTIYIMYVIAAYTWESGLLCVFIRDWLMYVIIRDMTHVHSYLAVAAYACMISWTTNGLNHIPYMYDMMDNTWSLSYVTCIMYRMTHMSHVSNQDIALQTRMIAWTNTWSLSYTIHVRAAT